MDALKAIQTRKSVRSFTGETLGSKELETIVRAGMQAPSAHGRRPWNMLTLTDREKMRKLIPLSPWWDLLEKAGAVIVVCSDTRDQEDISHEFQVDGCAAAAENMLLAAHAMGLGGVWLGVCEGERNCEKVKKTLGIPDYAKLICMLAVGVPAEPGQEPADRAESSKWFKESWGATAELNE